MSPADYSANADKRIETKMLFAPRSSIGCVGG